MKVSWWLWGLLSLALLLLALPSQAQTFGRADDFEDDTVGEDPTGEWYSFSKIDDPFVGAIVEVEAGGLDGTTKDLFVRCQGCSLSERAVGRFIHDAFQPDNASFYFDMHDSLTLNANTISFQGAGGTSAYFNLESSGTIRANSVVASCDNGEQTGSFSSPRAEHKFEVVFDWATETYDILIDDGAETVTDLDFCHIGVTSVSNFCVSAGSGGQSCGATSGLGRFQFDQFQYNGEVPGLIEEEGPPSPSEFDTGLKAFVTNIGFRTAESQMFFSLVMVGILTIISGIALKTIYPGRVKTIAVGSFGVLGGIFSVFLIFLQVWMFVVALVLFGVVIRAANTYATGAFSASRTKELLKSVVSRGQGGETEMAEEDVPGDSELIGEEVDGVTAEEAFDEPVDMDDTVLDEEPRPEPEPQEPQESPEPQGEPDGDA